MSEDNESDMFPKVVRVVPSMIPNELVGVYPIPKSELPEWMKDALAIMMSGITEGQIEGEIK